MPESCLWNTVSWVSCIMEREREREQTQRFETVRAPFWRSSGWIPWCTPHFVSAAGSREPIGQSHLLNSSLAACGSEHGSLVAHGISRPEVNTGYQRQVNLQDSPPLADQEDTARNTPLGIDMLGAEDVGRNSKYCTWKTWGRRDSGNEEDVLYQDKGKGG